MTIYLDAVWLLNFLFDWMILQLVHWLTKSSTKRGMLMFGGFVASLLVPLTLFYPNNIFASFFGKILFSFLIILSAFGFRNIRQFMKQFLSFYFVSFTLGGGLFGIYYLVGQQIQSENGLFITYNYGYGDMISWIFVVICFPIVWFFTRRRLDQVSFDKLRYDEMCKVTIELNGYKQDIVGFIDSGNSLVDPFTKKPVVVCDEIALKPCFTSEEWDQMKKCQEDWSFEKLPDKWLTKMRMIPYQGVGGKSAFLIVIKPDNVLVTYNEQQMSFNNVLIGVQFGELSADGSYHCLLHPKMMQAPKLQTIS
ncbi:sigma-E processing peptidase SpoIIGA [Salirhabdus sp. Marseille-P4669]|uniref:sigma-E processing peptidase SpoIIGA n=1 Tax=Salirhabdus sp. Marseille-P4669 TaxID=2042310 RepID=UPI0013597B60|nr:sigma-E processing peptidase SpoIIGA [Salirhabdus sp. Marseille-P4669]